MPPTGVAPASQAAFSLGLVGGDLADLTGRVRGFTGFGDTYAEELRPTPGGRAYGGSRGTGRYAAVITFSIDDDTDVHGLLTGRTGTLFRWEEGPRGRSAGSAKLTGEAIGTVVTNIGGDGARTHAVSLAADGPRTVGVFT